MKFISLFSGIEAASVALNHLGYEAIAFSEIDPFASAVLDYYYPSVPNLGDITKIDWSGYYADIVLGGSPCQSFSTAGNRSGLAGESKLMFEYIRAIQDIRPRWFLWENVPGVFSVEAGGGAFKQLLTEMEKLGYGLAWRVLDAQFFGVAQRRRRVFLVGYFGDARPAVKVLFEPTSVCGNTKTSKEKRASLAKDVKRRAGKSYTLKLRHTGSDSKAGGVGALIQDDVSATLSTMQDQTLFQNTLAFDEAQITCPHNGNNPEWNDPSHTISAGNADQVVCMASFQSNAFIGDNLAGTLVVGGDIPLVSHYTVRHLTPVECERLQGFPDGYTDIPYRGKDHSPDTQRYKALGNSWAVPVIEWIGKRILRFDERS